MRVDACGQDDQTMHERTLNAGEGASFTLGQWGSVFNANGHMLVDETTKVWRSDLV